MSRAGWCQAVGSDVFRPVSDEKSASIPTTQHRKPKRLREEEGSDRSPPRAAAAAKEDGPGRPASDEKPASGDGDGVGCWACGDGAGCGIGIANRPAAARKRPAAARKLPAAAPAADEM